MLNIAIPSKARLILALKKLSIPNKLHNSLHFLSFSKKEPPIKPVEPVTKTVNYPALTDGASSPRDEDFLLLPGNLLYTPSEKGMYSRGFLSTGSKGSPDPAQRIFREAL